MGACTWEYLVGRALRGEGWRCGWPRPGCRSRWARAMPSGLRGWPRRWWRNGPTCALDIRGADNDGAAAADVVVLATPWDSAIATLKPLREALAGKVVISMANALVREGREMLALIPPRGSVAAAVQAALPDSLVAAAFHHLPAGEMENLDSGLEADVLVCSDHPEATAATESLIDDDGRAAARSTPEA